MTSTRPHSKLRRQPPRDLPAFPPEIPTTADLDDQANCALAHCFRVILAAGAEQLREVAQLLPAIERLRHDLNGDSASNGVQQFTGPVLCRETLEEWNARYPPSPAPGTVDE